LLNGSQFPGAQFSEYEVRVRHCLEALAQAPS
jgi:hypothetical protein